MIFESPFVKSAVQRQIEAIFNRPASRRDVGARRDRAKAAMVLECVEHGYAQAKVAAVAKRAHMSTASIYRDFGNRDALLLEALQLAVGLFAQNWTVSSSHTEPVERMEALLKAHGDALADPFMGWMLRLYVHLANTSNPELLALGRVVRDANLASWRQEIIDLEIAGHLIVADPDIIVALILGGVERRSIFARLAFGENDDGEPGLAEVAPHMALALFQVFGTPKFWASRSDKPALGWVGYDTADQAQARPAPSALLDLPSQRLKAYAQRTLSRDVNRLDGESRKVRVQLAAMLECMELGYDAATMASVAARAGVSTASFYNDYPDKRALFIDAMLLQARFRFDYSTLIDREMPPAATIASLVYSISYVLADPDFLWFHWVSMASEISNAPLLIASSRATRDHTEGFWREYLTALEDEGVLSPNDHNLTLNLLLGPTQRRSVLSMVFFGAGDASYEELARLATASTDFTLRLVGTSRAVWSFTSSN